MSYRISLVVAIPLLVILTGALIAANSYVSTKASTVTLASTLFAEVAGQTAEQARLHVRQAAPAVELLAATLAEEPADEIPQRLLAVLRANRGFAWVSFTDEAGGFAGAHRGADGVITVQQRRSVDGKPLLDEHAVARDGTWTLLSPPDDAGVDPRTRASYAGAVAARRRIWTDPYATVDQDVPAVASAAPVYRRDGALRGVVTVEFDLQSLSAFVGRLQPSPRARVFLYTEQGTILADPGARVVTRSRRAGTLVTRETIGDDVVRAYFRAPGASRFEQGGARYFAVTRAFELEGMKWSVAAVAPESDFTRDLDRTMRFALAAAGIAVVVAVLLAAAMASRVAAPLAHLASEMDRVGRFELSDADPPRSIFKEIALMSRALVTMKRGLSSFGVYVPRDLVRAVLASGARAELGGKTKPLTVFFSDLAGFTTLSEGMSPDALVKLLSGYFDEMTKVIAAHGGTIDKFIGDSIMAFWNAPHDEPEHAARACEAALACQRRLDEMKAADPALAGLSARIGIATGEALVGNVGSSDRMNYTAMGDTVNVASRLESLSKMYGTRVLVSEACRAGAGDRIVMRAIDVVAVKGKTRGVKIYEPLALADEVDDAARAVAALSEEALAAYLARRWDEAIARLDRVLALRPGDAAATTMRARAAGYARTPPPADWSGAHVMTQK